MNYLTVLLVDDDPDDLEVFCRAIGDIDKNIRCMSADSWQHAFRQLLENYPSIPDFIFVDLNMPKVGGLQCLRLIKEDAHLHNVPVIVYSTSNYKRDIDAAMNQGAYRYLTKPSTYTGIRDAIAKIITSSGDAPPA